jgi:hypothetical protein
MEVWRSRSRRRGGGGVKGTPENSTTNSYIVTMSTYLLPLS